MHRGVAAWILRVGGRRSAMVAAAAVGPMAAGTAASGSSGQGSSHGIRTEVRCDDAGEVKRLLDENTRLREENRKLEDQKHASAPPVTRIVITGGPCAGKTSAMAVLKDRLEKFGLRVYVVPEAATILFHNGARFHDFLKLGEEGIVNFQVRLAQLQMRLEDTMYDTAAASGERAVILCDRGHHGRKGLRLAAGVEVHHALAGAVGGSTP